MSVEAYTWALNLAPIPNDPSGRPSPTCTLVLVALANHAYPDGTGAFPSVETMVRYTRLSERAVRLAIRRLEEHGTIRRGRQAVVAAHIDRSDRHPVCYDLAVEKMRDDLTDKQLDAIAASAPMLRGFIALARGTVRMPNGGPSGRPDDGVQQLPPVVGEDSTGGNSGTDGVHLRSTRGAPAAPKPSLEPPTEPTTTTSRRSRAEESGPAPAPEPADDALLPAPSPAPPSATFAEFYAAYPRHEAKAAAERAWAVAVRGGADPAEILAGARRFAADPNLPPKAEKRFIPHPASWLTAKRWNDDPLPPRLSPRGGSNHFVDPGSQAGDEWEQAFGGATDRREPSASNGRRGA